MVDKLMTPGEVARVFRVDPKTVTRWCTSGRLPSVTTPGGHRRIWQSEVERLLGEDGHYDPIAADEGAYDM